MDRWRAAGALLALAACIASSAAAPTASNQTALDLYEGSAEGCYYNFQHYGEGDRIMTNEPCLNCTCHDRMLMCYLRVCPFTKAIGQDCTVEKRADQCCPIVTCPDVPVDLLTSTSTTSPAEYGATGLGKLDKYGCSINGKYFPEGSKVPPTPNKPCEHCYCIRNMTTCVMQECTLHVDGCTPIYHKDVCCPVRYSCDHPEDEVPLLDDMSTTVRPTPGFLLTTTTVAPVTQMTQDCVHDDQVFADGALIKTEKACEHCYCMKGDIVCVVQECGAPMENEGKNCTSLPPREGQCCPDTYICEGDELTSEISPESTTESIEIITTLSPPRRTGVEGSGYRNEPDEVPSIESEVEGSGEDQEISKPHDDRDEMIPDSEDGEQYMFVSTKAPTSDEYEHTSTESIKDVVPDVEEKTDKPEQYTPTPTVPPKDLSEKYTTSGIPEEEILQVHEHVPTTNAPEIYERATTEVGESLNTVPDVIPEEELVKPHEFTPSTTSSSVKEEGGISINESTISDHSETSIPEYSTLSSISANEIEKDIFTSDEILNVTPEVITKLDHPEDDNDVTGSTAATIIEESESPTSQESEEEKQSSKPEQFTSGTTSYPLEESDKLTTEPDHAQNTVAVAEEETVHPHIRIPMTATALPSVEEERTTISRVEDNFATEKVIKEDVLEPHEHIPIGVPTLEETELTTAKSDKEVNTIPSESDDKTSFELDISEKTTPFEETKTTESSAVTENVETHYVDTKQTTVAETATRAPDSIVTKVDQYTITTEPSFRKEDESSVSTQKPKEFESNTDRSEFVDEGLIPTLDHDDKASPDVPSTEEEFTTLVPEYITTPSILAASVLTENLPGESTEKSPDVTTSIGESVETHEEPSRIPGEGDCLLNGITYRNNSVVPSSNNCHSGCRCASSIIKCDPIICSPPPDYMDNCQSIYDTPDSCCPTYVCDHSRETVPPQSDNQMSGTESPLPTPTIECRGDQCEISEPAKQPTEPSELCPSGSCLPETDHKSDTECGPEGCSNLAQKPEHPAVEKTEKCGDDECKPETSTQVQVSPIKPCEGEHCETVDELIHPTSPQQCKNEEDCKSLEIPLVQAKPCEGESCKNTDCGDGGCVPDVLPHENESVTCNDENGCNSQNIPIQDCTGDEPCKKKEITANDEKLPTECEGSNCKQESGITDTVNVDTSSTKSPTTFEEITEKGVTTEEEKVTELPEKITPKDTTDTDTYTTENQIKAETTDIDIEEPSVVEESFIKKPTKSKEENTETPAAEKGDKDKPVDSEITEKPEVIETEVAETSGVMEQGTNKPAVLGEEVTETLVKVEEETTELSAVFEMGTEESTLEDVENKNKPPTTEKENIEKPVNIEREGTELPTFTEEEGTQKPTIIDEEVEENPITVDEHDVKQPDKEAEVKPVLVDVKDVNEPIEEGTNTPVIIEEEVSTKPSVYEGESTYKPNIYEKEGTEIPVVTEEKDQEKPILVHGEDKYKPEDIEKQELEKPDIIEESTDITPVDSDNESKDKPNIIDDTSKLSSPEGLTEDSFREVTTEKLVEGEGTEEPAIISEDGGEKPVIIYEEITKKPDISAEEGTTKPIETEEKPDSEAPIVIEDKSTEKTLTDKESEEKPSVIREDDIEKPAENEAEKEKPAVDNEATEKPITEEDTKQTPASDHQDSTKQPALIIDEEMSETPSVSIEESSVKPVDGEISSESPSMFTEEGTEEPTMVEGEIEDSKKPVFVEEENTEKPIIIDEEFKENPPAFNNESNIIQEEITKKPLVTEEEGKIKPSTSEKENTDKPAPTEEEDTEKPADDKNEDVMKPVYIEREGTELPVIIGEENTGKPSLIDETTKDQPDLVDEEGTKKPDVIEEEDTKKPAFEAESTSQPAIIDEKEYSKEPDFVEKEVTDMPTYTEEVSPEKPLIIEGDKMKPTIEEENVDKPVSTIEAGTDKPIVVEEEGKDQPPIIYDELKEKPAVTEEYSTEKSEEDGSGTLKPETYPAEPEKEVKEPEIIVPTTKTTSNFEEITTTQIYESQTSSAIVNEYSTEFNPAGPIEISTFPQEISPTDIPVIKVTKPDDTNSKVPVILDHSSAPDLVTDHPMEPETTTKIGPVATVFEEAVTSILEKEKEPVTVSSISDLDVLTTNSYVDKTDTEEVVGTMGPDSTIDKEMLTTQSPDLYEVTEAKDKTTETEPVSEHEAGLAATSEPELPTTKAPGVDAELIEPQKETKPEKSDIPVTSKTEEESTTKYYQEEKYKPVPESHIVEVTSTTPEQSDISGTEVPENKDKDKSETEPLGQYTPEPEKQVTQLPEEEDLETDHPEIYSPNKDKITTETSVNTVTEAVSKFTEIEDTSLTGLGDIGTRYPEKSTEYNVPSATEKTDQYLDMTTTDKSPKLPENTIELDKPSIEKEKPAIIEKATTEIPIVTETQEILHASEKDVTSFQETTTGISYTSDHKFTTPIEEYTEKQGASTEIPPYSINVPQEHSKATESYITEHYTTESHQEMSTKSEEQEVTQILTTDTRRTTVQEEESVTKTPETIHTKPHSEDQYKPSTEETQTQSAELPLENAQTETPGVQVISEVPQPHVTEYQEEVTVAKEELTIKPEVQTPQHEEVTKATESHITEKEGIQTDAPIHVSEPVELSTKSTEPYVTEEIKITKVPEDAVTEKLDTATTLREKPEVSHETPTEKTDSDTNLADVATVKPIDEDMKSTEYTSPQAEFSETTPYLIELEEHPHHIGEDYSTEMPSEKEHTYIPIKDISTSSPSAEEHTYKTEEHSSTIPSLEEKQTTSHPEAAQEPQISELTTKTVDEGIEMTTKEAEVTSKPSEESLPEQVTEKISESLPAEGTTEINVQDVENKYTVDHKEYTTAAPDQFNKGSTPALDTDSEKLPISESNEIVPTEKETSSSEKPSHPITSQETSIPEEEFIFATTKATTLKQDEEMLKPVSEDKFAKPEETTKTSEIPASSTTTEASKPSVADMQPTDEIPAPEEEGHFPPSGTGYGEPEPDYVEEDQAFGPGTCRYGGKVYVSAQQIPRDDPCDFCFCFRSDIICLQQSCPPPIHGCHEEPIQGFCCPRYECPVSMATTVNVTTTTTTTTTTLPPHFPTHSYKGAAQRRGCQIKGHTYKVGDVVRSSSGPCLHCTCGGDGQMKCDPKACTPEPMLRQMIAAAVSAKRRR